MYILGPGERQVSMDELREFWDDMRAQGICYNGMTHEAMRERYGSAVRHVMGFGWVVKEES